MHSKAIFLESLYSCVYCLNDVWESDPHCLIEEGVKASCCDCAFIHGLWSEKEYLKYRWYFVATKMKAGINPETREVETTSKNSKFTWEKVDKDYRATLEYKTWRTSVFKRDLYTCQACNQVGGRLEAHHIKPFNKYKKLRFVVENGLTLCRPCHLNVHRKGSK
jgi:hypothetical protein